VLQYGRFPLSPWLHGFSGKLEIRARHLLGQATEIIRLLLQVLIIGILIPELHLVALGRKDHILLYSPIIQQGTGYENASRLIRLHRGGPVQEQSLEFTDAAVKVIELQNTTGQLVPVPAEIKTQAMLESPVQHELWRTVFRQLLAEARGKQKASLGIDSYLIFSEKMRHSVI